MKSGGFHTDFMKSGGFRMDFTGEIRRISRVTGEIREIRPKDQLPGMVSPMFYLLSLSEN